MSESQITLSSVKVPKWKLQELLAGIDKKNIHVEADRGKDHLT